MLPYPEPLLTPSVPKKLLSNQFLTWEQMLKETKDQNVKHSRFNLESFQMKAWQPLLKTLLNDFGWMKMTFRWDIIAFNSNFMHFLSLSPIKIVTLVWWLVMHLVSLQSTLVKEVLEWEKHAEDIQRLMVVVITKITVESEFTPGLPLTYFRSTSAQNSSSHFFFSEFWNITKESNQPRIVTDKVQSVVSWLKLQEHFQQQEQSPTSWKNLTETKMQPTWKEPKS